jgi:DNA-binding response OmpR family regulator
MTFVLVAADSLDVAREIESVLPAPEFDVLITTRGQLVSKLAAERTPDLVIADLQIGNMGGMAITMDLRLEATGGRLPHIPVLQVLDRRADVFMARRSGCEGWILKPLDPIRLRKAIRAVLAGETYEDPSYAPNPV